MSVPAFIDLEETSQVRRLFYIHISVYWFIRYSRTVTYDYRFGTDCLGEV